MTESGPQQSKLDIQVIFASGLLELEIEEHTSNESPEGDLSLM